MEAPLSEIRLMKFLLVSLSHSVSLSSFPSVKGIGGLGGPWGECEGVAEEREGLNKVWSPKPVAKPLTKPSLNGGDHSY